MTEAADRRPRGARLAVGALFLTNGALFANVVPRYPDIKDGLALSNAAFGAAIAAYGLGALLAGLGGGVLVARFRSARVAPVAAVGVAANLVLLALAPSGATLAAALFVAGALDSVADVANNTHGLRVERRYGRSILNSLHGVWSIGAVVGGLMGTAAVGAGVPVAGHLAVVAVVFAVVAAVAAAHLLRGPDDVTSATAAGPRRPARFGGIGWRLVALAAIAGSAQAMEDVGSTWSPVYLRADLGAAAAVGGLGFIALQAAQTLGRLLGDRVVTRFGDRRVARGGVLLAGGAVAVALLAPAPVPTVVAFGAVGLGIGTLIPAALRTADGLPGLRPGVGIAIAGSGMRVAALALPPVIGVVADAVGLRAALTVIPLLAVLVLGCSTALRRAPTR